MIFSHRRSTIKEHFEMRIDNSQNPEINSQDKSDKFSIETTSRNRQRNPSLVLYSNTEANEGNHSSYGNSSRNSKNIESIMEKDEVLEVYNPKRLSDLTANAINCDKENSIFTPVRMRKKSEHVNTESLDDGNNMNNNAGFNKVDFDRTKKAFKEDKMYSNVSNDTKIVEHNGTHLEGVKTERLIPEYNDDKEDNTNPEKEPNTNKLQIEMEIKDAHLNNSKDIKNINANDMTNIVTEYDDGKNSHLEKSIKTQLKTKDDINKKGLKISFIFTFIQVSDVILFNFYFFSISYFSEFKTNIYSFSFILTILYIVFTVLSHFFNKWILKQANKGNKITKNIMKLNVFLAILFTNGVIATILFYKNINEENQKYKIIIITGLFY